MPASVFAPYTPIATNVLFFDRPEATPAEGVPATKETWFCRLDMPAGIKHFSKTKPMQLAHFRDVFDWWNDRRELAGDEIGEKSRRFSGAELLAGGCSLDLCRYPVKKDEILPPKELIARYREERTRTDAEIRSALDAILEKIGETAE